MSRISRNAPAADSNAAAQERANGRFADVIECRHDVFRKTMDAIGKALWFIEIELCSELTLDRIAATCELSRFGLARMFALGTGWPVMRYVVGAEQSWTAYAERL